MARLTDNQAKAILADNLKRLMDEKGLDGPSLANMLGLEKQSVYAWLKMTSFPSATNLQKLIDVLHVTIDDLLTRKTAHSKGFLPVPLYGRVAAGTPLEMLPVDETREAPARFVDDDPECFLVKVRGDSMNRAIPDGCFALVSPKYTEPEPSGMYLVTVNGDDATIKRVRRLANGIELVPDSYDPTYRPKAFDYADEYAPPVKVIGRVVWWCAEF